MSNIRQRRAPSPSRDNYGVSSTSWEIATENSGESPHSLARVSIPMYNPMAMQSSSKSNSSASSIQPTTSNTSHRVSWKTIMEAKKMNSQLFHDNHFERAYHDAPGFYYGSISSKRSAYEVNNVPSMSPALIPDSAYRAYLSGESAAKKRNSRFDKITVAKAVGFYSLVGFVFLTFVGILIDMQPMFLQGILSKNEEYFSNGKKMKTFYAINIKDRLEPARHAYRGGLLYLLTAIVCLGYAHNLHHLLFKKGWQQYRDIDDVDSTVTTFHYNGERILGANDDYLPSNGAIHRQAYGDHNGFIIRTWHSTSVKLQRFGIYLESIWQARGRNRRRFSGAKDV